MLVSEKMLDFHLIRCWASDMMFDHEDVIMIMQLPGDT